MVFRLSENFHVKTDWKFNSSQDVFEYFTFHEKSDRECFFLVLLNSKNLVIDVEPHTIGSVDSCPVYPREIFRSGLFKNAVSIMLVHNHPSGETEPSESDRDITRIIVHGAELLGFKILDHIIIGKDTFYSFADEGLIDDYESEYQNKGVG